MIYLFTIKYYPLPFLGKPMYNHLFYYKDVVVTKKSSISFGRIGNCDHTININTPKCELCSPIRSTYYLKKEDVIIKLFHHDMTFEDTLCMIKERIFEMSINRLI
jgi:hypothetical protein